MPSADLKTVIQNEFGTPAVVVDLDIVERNIERLQRLCDDAGIANRPHIKTHKSPTLASLQKSAGAAGITCQKLGEAEVMVDAGFTDILISYNLFGSRTMERLGHLSRRASITVAADNATVVEALRSAGTLAGRPIPVVVECDTGRKRAGVVSADEAIELGRVIAAADELEFAGLMFYPTGTGWPDTQAFFEKARSGLKEHSLSCRIVSTGGTPNLPHVGDLDGTTEHRAGTYIFNDRMMMECGVASLDDCALTVYSTVVSRAEADRGILDAGSKTLTSDTGGLEGHGLILEHPEARVFKFAEEHGFLDLSACNDRPAVGDVVRVVPNHVCVVVNMVDQLIAVRGGEIAEILPVVARGRIV